MELRYNDSLLHLFVKLQIKQEQGDKNAANRAATVLSLILVMYKLLYIRIIHRDWKTLKCGDFYCRAFLSRENHSFIWLTQSRRIVGRHTQSHTHRYTRTTHTYTQTRTLSLSLSLPLSRSHPFSPYFHHETYKLYAMLGRFDCAVLQFLLYVSSIRVCRTLIIDLFDWETSNTLLIRLKHDPSIFWLIPKSSIAPISFLCQSSSMCSLRLSI